MDVIRPSVQWFLQHLMVVKYIVVFRDGPAWPLDDVAVKTPGCVTVWVGSVALSASLLGGS